MSSSSDPDDSPTRTVRSLLDSSEYSCVHTRKSPHIVVSSRLPHPIVPVPLTKTTDSPSTPPFTSDTSTAQYSPVSPTLSPLSFTPRPRLQARGDIPPDCLPKAQSSPALSSLPFALTYQPQTWTRAQHAKSFSSLHNSVAFDSTVDAPGPNSRHSVLYRRSIKPILSQPVSGATSLSTSLTTRTPLLGDCRSGISTSSSSLLSSSTSITLVESLAGSASTIANPDSGSHKGVDLTSKSRSTPCICSDFTKQFLREKDQIEKQYLSQKDASRFKSLTLGLCQTFEKNRAQGQFVYSYGRNVARDTHTQFSNVFVPDSLIAQNPTLVAPVHQTNAVNTASAPLSCSVSPAIVPLPLQANNPRLQSFTPIHSEEGYDPSQLDATGETLDSLRQTQNREQEYTRTRRRRGSTRSTPSVSTFKLGEVIRGEGGARGITNVEGTTAPRARSKSSAELVHLQSPNQLSRVTQQRNISTMHPSTSHQHGHNPPSRPRTPPSSFPPKKSASSPHLHRVSSSSSSSQTLNANIHASLYANTSTSSNPRAYNPNLMPLSQAAGTSSAARSHIHRPSSSSQILAWQRATEAAGPLSPSTPNIQLDDEAEFSGEPSSLPVEIDDEDEYDDGYFDDVGEYEPTYDTDEGHVIMRVRRNGVNGGDVGNMGRRRVTRKRRGAKGGGVAVMGEDGVIWLPRLRPERRRSGNSVGNGGSAHGSRNGSVKEEWSWSGLSARGRRAGDINTDEIEETRMPKPTPPRSATNDTLIRWLFQFCRFLSVIPAVIGTVINLYNSFIPPPVGVGGRNIRTTAVDFFVCAVWAILTGFQCLALTTGLLTRWRAYYAVPSTIIRLIALQAICWPATHFTLTFFDHGVRPVVCWALIGSTTCVSRSIQIWVTSNLVIQDGRGDSPEVQRNRGRRSRSRNRNRPRTGVTAGVEAVPVVLTKRKWDWVEVGVKCVLPAGILYLVTAWSLMVKEEFWRC